jgi:hypothetical protein
MRRRIVIVCLAALVANAAGAAAPSAIATSTGAIHPGVQTFTGPAQCTANFIFRDASATYIGQAAHCASTGAATSTNGCITESRPLGTAVAVTGATHPGTLVYSSWLAMRARNELDPNVCRFNDFALVRLHPDDVGRVDPTMPGFGGPVGVGGAATGAKVYGYGNSSLRFGITQLRPKQGVVLQTLGNGWNRLLYTVTPGIPGDSGSGFLNVKGQAIGVLSTVTLAPLPLSNGVGDLAKELDYARANGFPGLTLVNGTRPFKGDLLRAILDAG